MKRNWLEVLWVQSDPRIPEIEMVPRIIRDYVHDDAIRLRLASDAPYFLLKARWIPHGSEGDSFPHAREVNSYLDARGTDHKGGILSGTICERTVSKYAIG